MKTVLVLVVLALLGVAMCHAAPISRADRIATIEHLRRNAKEAMADLAAAKVEAQALQSSIEKKDAQIKTLTVSRDYWKTIAERLLFALSLAAGLLAGLVFFQSSTSIITRIYPPALPFSILISIGVGAATFGATWAALAHL